MKTRPTPQDSALRHQGGLAGLTCDLYSAAEIEESMNISLDPYRIMLVSALRIDSGQI